MTDTKTVRSTLEAMVTALDWAEDSVPRDGMPRTKFINKALEAGRDLLSYLPSGEQKTEDAHSVAGVGRSSYGAPVLEVLPELPRSVMKHPQLGELWDRFAMHLYAMRVEAALAASLRSAAGDQKPNEHESGSSRIGKQQESEKP
jgi:hypothetical protein